MLPVLREEHLKERKVYPCFPNHDYLRQNRQFTLFPLLPPEIRHKIWDIVLHTPVRVDLRVVRDKPWNPVVKLKLIRVSMNPYLTMICAESRKIALQHYRLCFEETSYINFAAGSSVCLCSGALDAFCTFMWRLTPYELSSIENLILKLWIWRDCPDIWFQSQIRKFTGLKMLQFFVEEKDGITIGVTKHHIREKLEMARGEDDHAWIVPRVAIIDIYGFEKDLG